MDNASVIIGIVLLAVLVGASVVYFRKRSSSNVAATPEMLPAPVVLVEQKPVDAKHVEPVVIKSVEVKPVEIKAVSEAPVAAKSEPRAKAEVQAAPAPQNKTYPPLTTAPPTKADRMAEAKAPAKAKPQSKAAAAKEAALKATPATAAAPKETAGEFDQINVEFEIAPEFRGKHVMERAAAAEFLLQAWLVAHPEYKSIAGPTLIIGRKYSAKFARRTSAAG